MGQTKSTVFKEKLVISHEFQGSGNSIYWNCLTNPRGHALIINFLNFNGQPHQTRYGSEYDVGKLQNLYTQLGYKVFTYIDLTWQETWDKIDDFRKGLDSSHDSVIVTLMSHGGGSNTEVGTLLQTTDLGEISSEQVIELFSNKYCPPLKGRPKIIHFQCCRSFSDAEEVKVEPNKFGVDVEDCIVSYSTSPGTNAFRYRESGSVFVTAFNEVMMHYAHNNHIVDILRKVHLSIKTSEPDGQIDTFELRDFTKDFFFNPGIWEGGNEGYRCKCSLTSVFNLHQLKMHKCQRKTKLPDGVQTSEAKSQKMEPVDGES